MLNGVGERLTPKEHYIGNFLDGMTLGCGFLHVIPANVGILTVLEETEVSDSD